MEETPVKRNMLKCVTTTTPVPRSLASHRLIAPSWTLVCNPCVCFAFFSFPSLSRAVRKTATCTQIHQHRNKKRVMHAQAGACHTGDAAIKASADTGDATEHLHQHFSQPARAKTTGVRLPFHNFAHDPILPLACIFASTRDRDHMVNGTSSGGSASRCPAQQRHSIDATSKWTARVNSQHPERQTQRERNPSHANIVTKNFVHAVDVAESGNNGELLRDGRWFRNNCTYPRRFSLLTPLLSAPSSTPPGTTPQCQTWRCITTGTSDRSCQCAQASAGPGTEPKTL